MVSPVITTDSNFDHYRHISRRTAALRVIGGTSLLFVVGGNWVGATAGAMIGGLLGTQLCGDKEIIGTKCQDIGVVFGTIGGAAAGTVTQAILGNHDGFQYIIDIDNSEKDSAFVQGDPKAISDGQKVVIIYGKDIRILPYAD